VPDDNVPDDVVGPRFQKEVVGKRIRVLFEIGTATTGGKCAWFDGRITSFRYHATSMQCSLSSSSSTYAGDAGLALRTPPPCIMIHKWFHTVRLQQDGDVRRLDLDQRWRNGTCLIEGVPECTDVAIHNAWDEKSMVVADTLMSEEEKEAEDSDRDREEEAAGDKGGREDYDIEEEEDQTPAARKTQKRKRTFTSKEEEEKEEEEADDREEQLAGYIVEGEDDDEDQKPAARCGKSHRRGNNDKKLAARRRSKSNGGTSSTTTQTSGISKTTSKDNDNNVDHNKSVGNNKTTQKRKRSGKEQRNDGEQQRTKQKKKKTKETTEKEEVASLSGAAHVQRRVRVNYTMSDGSFAWYDGMIAAHAVRRQRYHYYHIHFDDGDQIWMQLRTGGYEFV
jgi:hypothetical protein